MAKLRKKQIKTPAGRKASVRLSRWFVPYAKIKGNWRTTLQYVTKAQCGVYIIRSKKTKEILYVGHSAKQLYKTLYRHFQSWNDKTQSRTTYLSKTAYEVMVVLTSSCDRAYQIEQYYINYLSPRDGIRKLELDYEDINFKGLPKPKVNPNASWEELGVPF